MTRTILSTTLLFLILLVPDLLQAQQDDSTLFIIVRHAERADDGLEDRMENPGLSEAGLQRATHLASLLDRQSVDAVFSTDVKRTRMTIALVAAANGLEINYYDWEQQEAFLREISETYRGKTVLIAGHSNTIDAAANLILGHDHFADKFDHSDYENLLIINSARFGSGRILHLTY